MDAVSVEHVSKKFRIFHERHESIYEAVTSMFTRRQKYEDLEVLRDVTFSVPKGQMFGIVGRNGAGKTSLLRIISGVYKPDSGAVRVNGTLTPFLSLGVGFMGELTASDNIVQYGLLLGFSKKEISGRIPDVIEYAELGGFEDTKIKKFSAGMYSRLAFATAMQVDPDILMIDESIQVGDVAFQKKCLDSIARFRKRGKTVILVTHDMGQVRQHCDSAVLIEGGTVAASGPAADVVDAYMSAVSG